MFGKQFEKEIELIENALEDEQSKDNFKRQFVPLVESIAEKYLRHENAKGLPRQELIEAGWKYFDLALNKYKEKVELMRERKMEFFLFRTYFTWFIRQGIVEYIKENS